MRPELRSRTVRAVSSELESDIVPTPGKEETKDSRRSLNSSKSSRACRSLGSVVVPLEAHKLNTALRKSVSFSSPTSCAVSSTTDTELLTSEDWKRSSFISDASHSSEDSSQLDEERMTRRRITSTGSGVFNLSAWDFDSQQMERAQNPDIKKQISALTWSTISDLDSFSRLCRNPRQVLVEADETWGWFADTEESCDSLSI